MKKALILLPLLLLLIGCKDNTYRVYSTYHPVYTDYETFRSDVAFEGAKDIERNGGIYIYGTYLFLVEPDAGIHFIDNQNTSNPIQKGFLKIPGCTGIEINNDYLYANSFIDLLTFNISDLVNPILLNRKEDVFPQALPIREFNYRISNIDKNLGVVTSWEVTETKEDIDSEVEWSNCINCSVVFTSTESVALFDAGGVSTGTGGTGISGSITKFALVNDYLYVMDDHKLRPFSLSNPSDPIEEASTQIWREVETLFPYDHYLFMGTTTGMLIYDIQTPSSIQFVSAINHVQACDPVVVQDDYAYVTIRSNSRCGGEVNQLDIIDISEIKDPVLKKSYDLKNPHGLGIDGDHLFICDGNAGLKVYDASDPIEAGNNLVDRFKYINAVDIIPFNNTAIVIGEDGLYQYDYSDINDIKQLSKINIK